ACERFRSFFRKKFPFKKAPASSSSHNRAHFSCPPRGTCEQGIFPSSQRRGGATASGLSRRGGQFGRNVSPAFSRGFALSGSRFAPSSRRRGIRAYSRSDQRAIKNHLLPRLSPRSPPRHHRQRQD